MSLKEISYLELWQPVCSLEMYFKDIFISSSGGTFVQGSKTICAILIECIKRNNSVK